MDFVKKLKPLRASIAALQSERAELRRQVRSRSEVAEHVGACVAEWQQEARRAGRYALLMLSQGDHMPLMQAPVSESSPQVPAEADLGPLMVALLGADKVADVLLTEIDSIPEGMPCAARRARLEEIGAELLALETEEEHLITAAEEAGDYIARRPDARPEIVLADD